MRRLSTNNISFGLKVKELIFYDTHICRGMFVIRGARQRIEKLIGTCTKLMYWSSENINSTDILRIFHLAWYNSFEDGFDSIK